MGVCVDRDVRECVLCLVSGWLVVGGCVICYIEICVYVVVDHLLGAKLLGYYQLVVECNACVVDEDRGRYVLGMFVRIGVYILFLVWGGW